MNQLLNNIPAQWRVAFGILFTAIIMTIIYDYGWQVGLPLAIRNLSGLILFSCIMFGAGAAYVGARIYGSSYRQAIKIALFIPLIWHIKEMVVTMGFYGFAAGLYSGIQGPYLFYYAIMCMVIAIFHLCYQLVLKFSHKTTDKIFKTTSILFIPMFTLSSLEMIGLFVFGVDIFVFQGFLAGYRTFIM